MTARPRRPAGGGRPHALTRIATPADGPALLRLKQQLDEETSFMLLEPGERDPDPDALARHLAAVARSGNSAVIVAEADAGLAGYVELTGGSFRRNRTTAELVIGVLAQASGRGIGTALLRRAMSWAAGHGLHRLELTVRADNERAVGLYRRLGFAVEGRRSQCLLVDGVFADELYMAMLVPKDQPDDQPDDLPRPRPTPSS